MQGKEIRLSGVTNVRELGGICTKDGRKIKPKSLIRSGRLAGAKAEDIKNLKENCCLTTVIDLRTKRERAEAPDPAVSGVENLSIPVIDERKDLGKTAATVCYAEDPEQAVMEYIRSGKAQDMYVDLMTDTFSQRGFQHFFQILLRHKTGAVLWHCTGGKDRTGLAAVLLLAALGVEKRQILEEFEQSNLYFEKPMQDIQIQMEAKGCSEREIQDARALAGVNAGYMERAWDMAEKKYGSMENYLQSCLHLSGKEIGCLKELYLV